MFSQIIASKLKKSIKNMFLFTYPKVKVKTNQGIVVGNQESLSNGRTFLRFSGIPYAKKPVEYLRFKAPQELEKFDTAEIDCTREKNPCFQKSTITKKFIGSEDCLFLNVYVPEVTPGSKLAVMVFIHGGGYTFDSSSADFYSPEYLLMEDVIVVTINYRLHALGFLYLPSMGIYGNAGLKDQQMALKWVHENISNFNGDPERICLFGESAGGSSVYLHTLSSKSRKFISSAICQSGSALDNWLFQKDGETKTKRLAARLGASENNDKEIYETFLKASPETMFGHLLKLQDYDEERRTLPFAIKPIVEMELETDEIFGLTKPPLELITSQEGHINLPMMLGSNSGDGMTMSSYYRKNINNFKEDKVKLVPFTIDIDPMSNEAKQLGEEISQFYMGERGACEETLQGFIDYNSDSYFNVTQAMSALLNKKYHSNLNQYMYEFDFDGKLNFMKKALKMTKFQGACHFDELSYLFRHQIADVSVGENSREWKMRSIMCKLWTNFAKYGNPTPKHNNPISIEWESLSTNDDDLKYMILGDNPRMVTNNHSERIKFWKEKYEKYNGSFLNPSFKY